MTLETTAEVKFLSISKKHSDKANADFYKIALLNGNGEAGNLSCTVNVANYADNAGLKPMQDVVLTLSYCDDYDRVSFKATNITTLTPPSESGKRK